MKKQIAVWGGRFFQGIVYNEELGCYQYTSNDCLKQLEDRYEVLNFSMRNMDVLKAFRYIKKSLEIISFDSLILALGESEVKLLCNMLFSRTNLLISKNSFKVSLEDIILLLLDHKIKPIMVTLQPSDMLSEEMNENFLSIYDAYNDAIIDLALKYKLKLINFSSYYRNGDSGRVKFQPNQKAQKCIGDAIVKEI